MTALILVSARVDARLRHAIAEGLEPCPEFLKLEAIDGVELLDWNSLNRGTSSRSIYQSLLHVAAALPRLRQVDVVFSDGEHLGIPLACAMMALRIKTPHVVIGHHLGSRSKRAVLRWLKPYRRMDRILVHSQNQFELLVHDLPAMAPLIRIVPYGIDTEFWSPQPMTEDDGLVVSAGREHRDYETLLDARPETARLFIADHSPHSPDARRAQPDAWPANVERHALTRQELRTKYSQASVVVVPVMNTPFPFGITTLLEAMSMGRAVVVSDTDGLRGVIEHGSSGIVVPPGDALTLSRAIDDLLANPGKRAQLGAQARRAAVQRFGLDTYAGELARQLEDLGAGASAREDTP